MSSAQASPMTALQCAHAKIADAIAEECLRRIFDDMDKQIERLWLRSVFLGTFLVLIFTGYGYTLIRLVECSPDWSFASLSLSCRGVLNIICIFIALLGVLFSVLWIMMGKGSKAWQERYESALFGFIEKEKDDLNGNAVLKGLTSYAMAHGYLKRISPEKISNCIFSLKAGAYSVSKINIMLGVISLVFWILVGIAHSLFAAPGFVDIGIDFFMTWSGYPIVFLALSAVLSFVICRLCKSTSMQKE